MNILHVVPSYLPAHRQGGPLRSIHGLARTLAEHGNQVEVFTTDMDVRGHVPVDGSTVLDGVAVRYFPIRGPGRGYWAPALAQALRERIRHVDLLHLHSVFLWPTSAAARIGERSGVPYVLAPRGMLVPELLRARGALRKSTWLRLVERRTVERAAAIHVTSEREGEDLERLAVERRLALPPVEVVPNGADPIPAIDDARPSPIVSHALQRRPLALFLGRLSWKKGLDALVRALAQAPAVTLAIAGPDDEGLRPILERLAVEQRVLDRVIFVDHVDGQNRAALLRHSDLLVLPSRNENFGNVVLEAMSCGTPVLVSEGVGLADEVRRSGSGLVVESTPAALAGGLRSLLSASAAERARMSVAGLAAAEGYRWPAVAARVEQMYFDVVSRHRLAATETASSRPAAQVAR